MRIYGLIGYPLDHSFSRAYFTEKFDREGISAEYRNFPLERIDDFNTIIRDVKELRGLNVTVPYKQTIIPHLDRLSDDARKIGAVNTICFEGGSMIGHNTDWTGFRHTITPWIDRQDQLPSALILGRGGAAMAVAFALETLGIEFRYVSRSPGSNDLGYSDITAATIHEFKLIINTTPLGMYPDKFAFPDIPYESLTQDHLLYDLVYNPGRTTFLKLGEKQGARIMNGLEMLYAQAEAAWALWQGSLN